MQLQRRVLLTEKGTLVRGHISQIKVEMLVADLHTSMHFQLEATRGFSDACTDNPDMHIWLATPILY